MARLDTLIAEFRECRSVYPYAKLVKLLAGLGYEEMRSKGGSSRRFAHRETRQLILLHEPHPGNEIKSYKVREIQDFLKERKQI